jgi:hypothetical protein
MPRPGEPNAYPRAAENARELDRLVAEIKDDLRAADESAWERLRRYRAAGEGLTRAKRLVRHGKWDDWLKGNFGLSDRRARQLMAFAKTDVTSVLGDQEAKWRKASGNGAKAGDGRVPLTKDRVTKAVFDEASAAVNDLGVAEGFYGDDSLWVGIDELSGAAGVYVAALRSARRAFVGGKGVDCAA